MPELIEHGNNLLTAVTVGESEEMVKISCCDMINHNGWLV